MEFLTAILLKAFERMLAIIVGSLLVYLGYRLFVSIPVMTDGEGKLTLPSGASIHLTKVGPGVFFSLFGSAIVAMALLNPTDYKQSITAHQGDRAYTITQAYSGIGAQTQAADSQERARLQSRVVGDIYTLNTLLQLLPSTFPKEKRGDLERAVQNAKLAMMKSVWGKDWGDYLLFEAWILKTQGISAPPAALSTAAKIFQHGQGGGK